MPDETTGLRLPLDSPATLGRRLDPILLRLINHIHDGSAGTAIDAAGDAPTLTVETPDDEDAYLAARATYFYAYTYVDELGRESAKSAVAEITLPDPIARPDRPTLTQADTGGTLGATTYAYVISYYTGSTHSETEPSDPIDITVVSAVDTNTVTLAFNGDIPDGVDGINIFRLDPTAPDYGHVWTLPIDPEDPPTEWTDDGTVTPNINRAPARSNGTLQHLAVNVELPEAVPAGYTWRLYRSLSPDDAAWDNTLIAIVVEETTEGSGVTTNVFLDRGDSMLEGSPPGLGDIPIPSPQKVSLPDHTTGDLPLARTTGNLPWARITDVPGDIGGGSDTVVDIFDTTETVGADHSDPDEENWDLGDEVLVANIADADASTVYYIGVESAAQVMRLPAVADRRAFVVYGATPNFTAFAGPPDETTQIDTIDVFWLGDQPGPGGPFIKQVAFAAIVDVGGDFNGYVAIWLNPPAQRPVSADVTLDGEPDHLSLWPDSETNGVATVLRRRLENDIAEIYLPGDVHPTPEVNLPEYRPGSMSPIVIVYLIQGSLTAVPYDYIGVDPEWYGNPRFRPGLAGAIPAEAGYALVLRLTALGDDLTTCDWAIDVLDDHFDHDGRPAVASTELTLEAGIAHPIEIEAVAARDETLTYQLVAGAAHGALYEDGEVVGGGDFDPTNNLTFVPDVAYTGADNFTWRAVADGFPDDDGYSNAATVAITVTPAVPPTVDDISIDTAVDEPIVFPLAGNDPNGRTPLTYDIDTPSDGDFSGTGGTRQYTPGSGFIGIVQTDYRATNSVNVTSDDATITIGVSDPVTADDDDLATPVDEAVAVTLVGHDPHTTGTATYEILTGPDNGVLSGTGASRLYTPDSGYEGPDTITYRFSNGIRWSDPATITITVG